MKYINETFSKLLGKILEILESLSIFKEDTNDNKIPLPKDEFPRISENDTKDEHDPDFCPSCEQQIKNKSA